MATLHLSSHHAAERRLEPLGRAGIAARGAVYCIVAWLAILIASGDLGETADRHGALSAVARQPLGRWLLLALAVAFAAYAAWRIAEALTGRTSKDDDAGWVSRAASAGKAAMYTVFAVSTLRYAVTRAVDGHEGVRSHQTWTARAMQWPGGRALVVVVGVALVAYGLSNLWRALTGSFMEKLKEGEMGQLSERTVRAIGTAGHTGRALSGTLVGAFVAHAGLTRQPEESRGLDGALKELVELGVGPTLVLVTAGGLIAFGLYCFAEARFRRVLGR